jgi:hypothetical protein
MTARISSGKSLTRVAGKLAALQCFSNSIFVADSTTSCIYKPGTLLKVFQQLCIDQSQGSFVEGAINRDDITLMIRISAS